MASADLHRFSPAELRTPPVERVASLHDLTYWLLLVLLFTVPWTGVITFGPLGTMSRAFGLLVASVAALSLVVERPTRRLTDAHVLAIAFTVWVVASYYWSIDRTRSLGTAGTMVMTLILLLIMWEFGGGARRLLAMMAAYVAGTSFTCGTLLYRYLEGYSVTRFSVTGTNPNDLAYTASVAIPIAWYVAEKVTSRPARILLRLYVPLAVLAILLTASRSALFTTTVGLLVLPLSARGSAGKQVLIACLLAGSLAAGLLLLPEQPLQRVSTARVELVEGDLNGRKQLWALGWQIAGEHPLMGVGTGAARVEIDARRGEEKGVHNTYLSILVELGAVGFALFLLILVLLAKQGLSGRGFERDFATVLLATLLVGLLPRHWEYAKVTWIVIGILLGQAAWRRQLRALPLRRGSLSARPPLE